MLFKYFYSNERHVLSTDHICGVGFVIADDIGKAATIAGTQIKAHLISKIEYTGPDPVTENTLPAED